MKEEDVIKVKDCFDSIVCLCVEGVEFMTRVELAHKIIDRATKGYKICKDASQQAVTLDTKKCGCRRLCPEIIDSTRCDIH